jgi:hypothetical protein
VQSKNEPRDWQNKNASSSLSEMTGLTYFAALLDHLLHFAALLDLRLFWITYFAALLDHLLCGFIGSPSHVRHGMRIFIENYLSAVFYNIIGTDFLNHCVL